jgi:SAM-dependent methyltransferase
MHDSAFRIGELVMQTYCDLPKARILEIGSMDVNGSLRDVAEPTTQYVGVDLEEGPAVDVVVKPGEKLPFDDASFDLIMASSAFEHGPRFWETFLEMCRVAQPGGHIYVNAPSNGGVHRYPLDCWRFYPDAGLALMDYAQTNEIQIDLVESFVGKRYRDSRDEWNDFVAIFRKGPSKVPMNVDFIYKRYPSYNTKTWSSPDLDYETSITEDMQLGRDLRQQIAEQAGKVEGLEKERSEAEKLSEKLTADLRISEAEASQLRSAVGSLEQQVENLSSALQAQTDTLAAALSDARDEFRHFEKERVKAEEIRDKLTADLRISESEASQLRSAVGSLEQQVENLSGALRAQTDAFARIQKRDLDLIGTLEADISKLRDEHLSHVDHTSAELARLRASEAELGAAVKSENAHHERYRMGMEWLRAIHIAMAGRPFWWFLLPARFRRQREYEALRSVGLFDGPAYLARHPDVAAKGADPLRHYIAHGMYEGRDRAPQ